MPSELAYEERYSDAEMVSIIEQGMISMCACPAQVADTVRKLRTLLNYQLKCSADPANDAAVHAAIAKSTIQSHRIMQDCLDTVIALEKWGRATLQQTDRKFNHMMPSMARGLVMKVRLRCRRRRRSSCWRRRAASIRLGFQIQND
jgi:hypothetical protein